MASKQLILFIWACCILQQPTLLVNTEWRYYFDSEYYDYLKFGEEQRVIMHSAEVDQDYFGQYFMDGSNIIIELDSSTSENWSELDKRTYGKQKYVLTLSAGQLKFLELWKFRNVTGEYELSDFRFDDYLFTENEQ